MLSSEYRGQLREAARNCAEDIILTKCSRLNLLIIPQSLLTCRSVYCRRKVNMEADQEKLSCVRCGRPMRFARSILRPAKLPKLDTFECSYCGLAITAEGAAELLKIAVQFVP